jgi:cbb3-type cytochrome oxidase maturation protein
MSLGHLIVLSLALGVGAWLFFLWSVRSGQYEDPEGPKYRMLDDEEDDRAGPSPERPRASVEGGSPPEGRDEAERGRR